jgi:hypothetical protein
MFPNNKLIKCQYIKHLVTIEFVRIFRASHGDMKPSSMSIHDGRLKISWTGNSAPLLYRGRRRPLCQVVVVGIT